MLKVILFDVDDTLYPRSSSLFPMIRERIIQYMIDYLGLGRPQAVARREEYLKAYGTATRGLFINDHINIHEYLAYVHDLPITSVLAPDHDLDAVLSQIRAEKYLFTNATRLHAVNVTEALGITRLFARAFGLEDFDFISKPDPHPYEIVLREIGVPGCECMLLEDSPRNLETARTFGMTTVLVGDAPFSGPPFNFHIPRVHDVLDIVRPMGVVS